MKTILFNTEMVKAILDGRKMVTRRVIKPQPKSRLAYIYKGCHQGEWGYPDELDLEYLGKEFCLPETLTEEDSKKYWIPPYHVGNILYVRETWAKYSEFFLYRTNCADTDFMLGQRGVTIKWHPSIHMPKEAARLFLRVTDVRAERLQDIDYEGCKAEGIWDDYKTYSEKYHENLAKMAYPYCFSKLWNSTIKKADLPRYGRKENPWVWGIEFERISKEAALSGGVKDV